MSEITKLWQKYERGVIHHRINNIYSQTEQNYNFYQSQQWKGLESGGEKLPFYNIIQPTVKFKSSMISMNNMEIVYTSHNTKDYEQFSKTCERLNAFAAQKWESKKMDTKNWEIVKSSCIAGDSYIYFYNSDLDNQVIDNTNIYFGDEQQGDVQKQPYILIFERRSVSEVVQEAIKNHIPSSEIELIKTDEENEDTVIKKDDPVTDNDKCSCVLCLYKKDGIVHISRSTKYVTYQKETKIDGLHLYPIASYVWLKKKNSARGIGEVSQMIPNQISINKQLANREMSSKSASFPRIVYNPEKVENPESLLQAGVPIKLSGDVRDIDSIFKNITCATMSPDAKKLQDEMIERTRDLASAGNAALGDVDPTKASGVAITAVRDQSAIPLNEQVALYKQYVEDIALIWYDMWCAYNTNGMQVYENVHSRPQELVVTHKQLSDLKMHVRIDVCPTNPYTKLAQEQSLENALSAKYITFSEYVDALSETSSSPKWKFKEILKKRSENPETKTNE